MKIILLAITLLFSGRSISNVTINTDFNMLALKYTEGEAIGAKPQPRISGVKS